MNHSDGVDLNVVDSFNIFWIVKSVRMLVTKWVNSSSTYHYFVFNIDTAQYPIILHFSVICSSFNAFWCDQNLSNFHLLPVFGMGFSVVYSEIIYDEFYVGFYALESLSRHKAHTIRKHWRNHQVKLCSRPYQQFLAMDTTRKKKLNYLQKE